MIDQATKDPLRVRKPERGNPWIDVSEPMLPRLRAILDQNRFEYWLDDWIVNATGRPSMGTVYLSYRNDPDRVQQVLDGTP